MAQSIGVVVYYSGNENSDYMPINYDSSVDILQIFGCKQSF